MGRGSTLQFTPLNQKRETILKEILHIWLIQEPTPTKRVLSKDPQQGCECYKTQGHKLEDCFVLKNWNEEADWKGNAEEVC